MSSVAQLVRERFGELTEIQKIAIPKVLAGENVLIIAPTGYGKTESALLPVLEKVHGSEGGICALYITPLRALSRDLKERFEWWCKRLDISHDIRTGDTNQAERTKHRKNPPKILLTTVESLQALMLGPVMRKHLANVKFVIVDEVHDILDNKRGVQLSFGLERLSRIADFQRIAISATIANEGEAAKLIFGDHSYAICEAGRSREMNIETLHIEKHDERLSKIKQLAEENRSLIFVNTRSTAEELGASLKKNGAPIEIHHGSLAKDVRIHTEEQFKAGFVKSLVCTSSLELGIDVGDISLSVQYGSPHQVFRLIQRTGRSGHSLQKTPKGIIIAVDFDDLLESEVVASFAKSGWLENKGVERGALDVIAHQLLGVCLDFGRTNLLDAHALLSQSYAYGISYEKLRKIALQLYSEGLIYYDEEPGEKVLIKASVRAREYYSKYLSTIPKTKRFFMKDITTNRVISMLDEEFVVNLDAGTSFLSHGRPWRVIDITDKEILAEPTFGTDIMVPSWTGEDIPVAYEVAQEVGRMRSMKKITPIPDDKTIVLEIIDDLIIVHACFGTKVNGGIARVFARNLSRLVGESVRAVADPYRIFIKLPFPLQVEYILREFNQIKDIRRQLEESVAESSLLRLKFHQVARMFGLISEDANVGSRFIEALRNTVVYEETVRSIFFRYFDIEKMNNIFDQIRNGKIKVIADKRKEPSYFSKIGLGRISGGENLGGFEPRERIIEAFRETILSKTLQLKCANCQASRFLHLAGAPDAPGQLKCHRCNQSAFNILSKDGEIKADGELEAALIRTFGKKALIALSTYGVGPSTANRILKRLHKDESTFYLELVEAQKLFVKNKKYWKI